MKNITSFIAIVIIVFIVLSLALRTWKSTIAIVMQYLSESIVIGGADDKQQNIDPLDINTADDNNATVNSDIVSKKIREYGGDHIVVDTLNLVHWMVGTSKITDDDIKNMVLEASVQLKKRFKGRIMFVIKDRNNSFNDEQKHKELMELAHKSKCYIYVVEKYKLPPKHVKRSGEHAEEGRDDFFATLLARKWRCAVLTEDRLKDFGEFRQNVPQFQVYEFTYWKDTPIRDYVNPSSPIYRQLRKQRRLNFSEYITK